MIALAVLGLGLLLYSASIPALTISPTTIPFPDLSPETTPEIPASSPLGITVQATELKNKESWDMQLCANSDLKSGSHTIPISKVRWTISGTSNPAGSFQNGTLVRNVCQPAGTGEVRAPHQRADISASVQFYLTNSSTYAPGTYTALVDVRITVPGAVKTASATLKITIAPRLSVTLGMSSINFSQANPDLVLSIGANENPVSVTVKAQVGSTVTLTCQASNDLISGTNVIPALNVSWTATGSGFTAGTLSKTSPQLAGQWTGVGSWSGTFSFRLANSWSYATGVYSMSVIFTATAL